MTDTTKQHIIRVNVRGKGYGLYAGLPDSDFIEQPLGISSDTVPRSYLSLEKRLDEVLETRKVSWSLAFCQNAPNEDVMVAYGSFVEERDEYGRPGIFFIHALRLHRQEDLLSAVGAIVASLSHTGIRSVIDDLGEIARGKKDVNEFLITTVQRLENKMHQTPTNAECTKAPSLEIHGVDQDCAGASAIAWLTMAQIQQNASAPWEVFETLASNGNIQTVSTNSLSKRLLPASLIQSVGVRSYFISTHKISNLTPESIQASETVPVAIIESDQAASDSNWTTATWLRISAITSTICTIALIVLGLFFIQKYDKKQAAFSQELRSIAEKVNSSHASVLSSSNQPKEPPSVQGPGELIDNLFDESTRRQSLNSLLQMWKSDSRIVPLALERAQRNIDNKVGVLYVIYILEEVDMEQLRQHQAKVVSFLNYVSPGRPQTEVAAAKVRYRLSIN